MYAMKCEAASTAMPAVQTFGSKHAIDLLHDVNLPFTKEWFEKNRKYPSMEEEPVGLRSQRAGEPDRVEIYEREKIASEFFEHIAHRHGTTNDKLINNVFVGDCKKNNVVGIPVFARVTSKQLALANYALNNGLCHALGTYFKNSVRRLNQAFVLKRLLLDNNNLADSDFAALLQGLKSQKRLEALVYANNEMG
jgi:hypothetical protein